MDIYSFIKEQEVGFTRPIPLEDGWNWSMKDHLRRSFLYKNSQFAEENDNRDLRPYKNIIRPILNIQYRTEGFDVKDIDLFVENFETYYKSFLVKKYHEKWVLDNAIDTFIDDVVESYVDYGGVLVKDIGEAKPEVIDLRTLAFCNQTDILAFPFCIKHSFSPSQLREMTKWNEIERLITLCKDEKEIIVYEVHGILPHEWIGAEDEGKDIRQIQVVSFYKDQNKQEIGITLFKSKEPKLPFKFLKRDPISGRALGFGGIEELFEPQIWTNFSEVKIMEMLDAASKTLFKSNDPTFRSRNNLRNADNNEILTLQEGKDINQLDTYPRNLQAFVQEIERLEIHAQKMGAASEGMLGEAPTSGTPFKLYESQNIEAKSMHKYRQGKIAVFVDEIYRDWILPHIAKEITNEQNFLATLSADELKEVMDKAVVHAWNQYAFQKIIKREEFDLNEQEIFMQKEKENFIKNGNKRFVEILKDEFKNEPLGIFTNIAGKQKNLALLTDKLVNVLRQFIATPQLRQDPEMVKLLNMILESSGMSPIMFGTPAVQQPIQQPMQGGTEPLKALTNQPAMV